MLNIQRLSDYLSQEWQKSIVPSLFDFIKIPCKSPHFDKHWQKHGFMEEAVNHVANWCRAHAPQKMSLEIVRLAGRTPLLFIEVPGQGDETVLLYGHLDKQPEMSGWRKDLGPWTPVLEENRLFGRGGADDGYAAYTALTAIRALEAQGLPHSRCVLIIETCEESGSYDLPFYIDVLKDRIGEPNLIIGLDSGAGNYEQLWMTTSLRGNVVGELSVELLEEGVHSGNASGIVADSFRVAKQLISRLEDEQSGAIQLAALHCEIPKERIEQAKVCAKVLGERTYCNFPFHPGVEPLTKDQQALILNRTWRPALAVIGAAGLPSISDGGNVLRPKTVLKLSMRLPPLVCSQRAGEAMQKALTENPPYQAKVSFRLDSESSGWHSPPMAAWLAKAVDEASQIFYQQPPAYMGEGGSIPFMGMLGEKFPKAQFMITGVCGPHSNAHGPNEFLDLKMAEKLTACVAYVLYAILTDLSNTGEDFGSINKEI